MPERQDEGKWRDISTAPRNRNVELQVADGDGCYTLRFPCRRTDAGWINAVKNLRLDLQPVRWREIAKHF